MFYAGCIAPGWGGSTQGSRLGRLSEVLKASEHQEPEADAAQEEVAGLHDPDPSEHLAHVAATERQLDDDSHDYLWRPLPLRISCFALPTPNFGSSGFSARTMT